VSNIAHISKIKQTEPAGKARLHETGISAAPQVSRSACCVGFHRPPIRRTPVMTSTPFKAITVASDPKDPMPTVKHASTIIGAFEEARSEIIGKAVVLTDGKAGTVENVWLDELHGLRVSIRGHDGKWPISTIKLVQGGGNRL
jgi:hypothetical protein